MKNEEQFLVKFETTKDMVRFLASKDHFRTADIEEVAKRVDELSDKDKWYMWGFMEAMANIQAVMDGRVSYDNL